MEQKSINKIQLLPEHLVDQIKAGEVIERPSALIKELIENSIDANSTQINIHLIGHGMDLINIEDNGDGILFEDLPFAFCRHATSKISRFEDLYDLHSFGFRGEALASIAAVSRVSCSSAPKGHPQKAGNITIHGGKEISHIERICEKPGTNIFIKNLFYNTPARLKFIKSKISEKNALKKIIYAFILTHPEVCFSIKWDESEKELFPATPKDQIDSRIKKIFFKRKTGSHDLLTFTNEYEGHRLTAHFSYEKSKGNAGKHQFLFVNGRLFYDKRLHQAVIRGLDSFWGYGLYGHYTLNIQAPQDQIDVNVHPNKTEIKFLKSNILFSLLSSGILKKIREFKELEQVNNQKISDFEQKQPTDIGLTSSPFFSTAPEKNNRKDSHVNCISNTFFTYNNFLGLTPKIFGLYWYHNTKNKFPIEEKSVTPLLISEPFKVNQTFDQYIDDLKKIGLEFDRLDQETIVLRTLPYFISTFSPQLFLSSFISFLETSPKGDILSLLLEFTSSHYMKIESVLTPAQVHSLVQDLPISTVLDAKGLLPLNSNLLLEAFNG